MKLAVSAIFMLFAVFVLVDARRINVRQGSDLRSEVPPVIQQYNARSSEIPTEVAADVDAENTTVRDCNSTQVGDCLNAFNEHCADVDAIAMCDMCYRNLIKCYVDAGCEDEDFFVQAYASCMATCQDELICSDAPGLVTPLILCLVLGALLAVAS